MPNYPWFRVYSNDILSDRKLARICQVCNVSKALVRGVWLTLMAMANDSPVRGVLLIAVGLPVTEDEIRADLGLDTETFEAIMSELVALRMIERGDCVVLLNFVKRNPPSDSSTERVRRHREREQQPARNVTEALQQQPGNAIESEGESESEREKTPPPADPFQHPIVQEYRKQTNVTPSLEGAELLTQTFGGAPTAIADLDNVLAFWKERRWGLTNVTGICDRYNRGDYPGGHNGNQPTGPPGQATGPPIVISGLDETPEWLRG